MLKLKVLEFEAPFSVKWVTLNLTFFEKKKKSHCLCFIVEKSCSHNTILNTLTFVLLDFQDSTWSSKNQIEPASLILGYSLGKVLSYNLEIKHLSQRQLFLCDKVWNILEEQR